MGKVDRCNWVLLAMTRYEKAVYTVHSRTQMQSRLARQTERKEHKRERKPDKQEARRVGGNRKDWNTTK